MQGGKKSPVVSVMYVTVSWGRGGTVSEYGLAEK